MVADMYNALSADGPKAHSVSIRIGDDGELFIDELLKEMTITLPVPTQISLNGHPIGVEPKTNNRGQSVYSLKDIYIGNYVCDLEDTHLYALPKGSLIEDYDRDVEFKDINRDASNVSDPFLNLLPELKEEVDNQLSALYEVAYLMQKRKKILKQKALIKTF